MSILKDTIHTAFDVIQTSKKKAEQVVDDLIGRGKLEESLRSAAIMELLSQAEEVAAEIRSNVGMTKAEAQILVASVVGESKGVSHHSRRSDVPTLEKRVSELARSIDEIKKKLES